MSYPVTRRRFTIDEYHQMAQAGILTDDDRVELVNGEIIEMSPISPNHAGAVNRISRLFNQKVDDTVIVSVQNPIQLNDYSEPQPDIALLKLRDDFYVQDHPHPEDVFLVVEVAESSTVRDRIVKMPAYANALIAELWIVDLQQDLIEIYSDPVNGAYQSIRQTHRGETLAPQSLPLIILKAEDILG